LLLKKLSIVFIIFDNLKDRHHPTNKKVQKSAHASIDLNNQGHNESCFKLGANKW